MKRHETAPFFSRVAIRVIATGRAPTFRRAKRG